MKPKKPDRLERMVEKLAQDCDGGCYPSDVVALLRKEHAWMRRMIKSLDDGRDINTNDDYQAGMLYAYVLVIRELDQRRK